MKRPSEKITSEVIEKAFDYEGYRTLMDELLAQNKTTGPNQSESYIEYTRMNQRRMKRWEKNAKISDKLETLAKEVDKPQTWLVLTEAWCGDAAQNIPFIQKVADLNPLIQTKFILRDENPEIMSDYLTNGGKSIPKVVALADDLEEELFTWGPRPEFLQNRLKEYKEDPKGVSSKEFSEGTHLWYARDKNNEIDQEFSDLISQHITK